MDILRAWTYGTVTTVKIVELLYHPPECFCPLWNQPLICFLSLQFEKMSCKWSYAFEIRPCCLYSFHCGIFQCVRVPQFVHSVMREI